MIFSLCLLYQATARPVLRTGIQDLSRIVWSKPLGGFVTYQGDPRKGPDELLVIDEKGKTLRRSEFEAPGPLVGTNASGLPTFQPYEFDLRVLDPQDAKKFGPELWFGVACVRGAYQIRAYEGGLVAFKDSSPLGVFRNVFDSDAYGIDEASGRTIVVRSRKGALRLDLYEAGNPKGKTVRLRPPKGLRLSEGFPFGSVEFLDRRTAVCAFVLNRPLRKGEEASTHWLCSVDLASGTVEPWVKLASPVGDLMRGIRQTIAVSPSAVAVLSGGELLLVATSSKAGRSRTMSRVSSD